MDSEAKQFERICVLLEKDIVEMAQCTLICSHFANMLMMLT